MMSPAVVNVVLLHNPAQRIDSWISTRQTLFSLGTRPHVLISRPMKLDPSLIQHFLDIQLAPWLTRFTSGPCTDTSPSGVHLGLNDSYNCLAAPLAPCLAP